MARFPPLAIVFLCGGACLAQERVVESVLPALSYGPRCASTVDLQNLGDRPVVIDVEAHRGSGALVPLAGHPEIKVRLGAGERAGYKLEIAEETTSAWVKVRERIAPERSGPVVAVNARMECVDGERLRATVREAAFPTGNPWYSGEVGELRGDVLAVINTSERAAKASACYSSGALYSVPGASPGLRPVCSAAFDILLPPFAAREFPVDRQGSSHFSLKTEGAGIVLQMLRPLAAGVRIYTVDSSIQFGQEVPDGLPPLAPQRDRR